MKNKIKFWKEFDFKKVFGFKRGRRLVRIDQSSGDVAYISSSKQKNGIDNYISPPNFMKVYENVLTLNNSGSVGYCFYHNYPIVCSDHCTIIWIKDEKIKLNSYIALFLKPIIESMREKYNFAREISDYRLKKEKIILPKDESGNPDWRYMENFVKNLSQGISFVRDLKLKKHLAESINCSRWKEFKINDLFILEKGERLVATERKDGNIALLTATSNNNGIAGFIDYNFFKEKKKFFKNKITVDMFCNVFYQPIEYFSDDNIHTLLFKNENYKIQYENLYVNLFLVSIIRLFSLKYGYGRQVRLKRFEEEIIRLPVDSNEEPDWQFMEDYIKSLPYSKALEN